MILRGGSYLFDIESNHYVSFYTLFDLSFFFNARYWTEDIMKGRKKKRKKECLMPVDVYPDISLFPHWRTEAPHWLLCNSPAATLTHADTSLSSLFLSLILHLDTSILHIYIDTTLYTSRQLVGPPTSLLSWNLFFPFFPNRNWRSEKRTKISFHRECTMTSTFSSVVSTDSMRWRWIYMYIVCICICLFKYGCVYIYVCV